jgi:hypothetical protein
MKIRHIILIILNCLICCETIAYARDKWAEDEEKKINNKLFIFDKTTKENQLKQLNKFEHSNLTIKEIRIYVKGDFWDAPDIYLIVNRKRTKVIYDIPKGYYGSFKQDWFVGYDIPNFDIEVWDEDALDDDHLFTISVDVVSIRKFFYENREKKTEYVYKTDRCGGNYMYEIIIERY